MQYLSFVIIYLFIDFQQAIYLIPLLKSLDPPLLDDEEVVS